MSQSMATWIGRNAALRALREQRAALKEGKKLTQDALIKLALTERDRLLKESQLQGTYIHTLIEKFLSDKTFVPPLDIDMPKKYIGYWRSFQRFYEFYPIKPILQEEVLWDDEWKWAGRMDFYGTLTQGGVEKRVLIDFKTSNFPSSTWGLQLAAYKRGLELRGFPVDECYILHLRSGGYYDLIPYNEPFDNFVLVRKVFSWKARIEKPKFEFAFTPEEAVQKLKLEIQQRIPTVD